MHLRHGRTKSPPRTTPTALQPHRLPPHHLPLSSQSMRRHHRARSRPLLGAGQAQHGSMKTKINTFLGPAVCRVQQPRPMKRWSLQHIIRAKDLGCTHLQMLLPLNPGSIRDAHSVSIHTNLKMERLQRRARALHHLWCDKVNEKIISSTVLLVS